MHFIGICGWALFFCGRRGHVVDLDHVTGEIGKCSRDIAANLAFGFTSVHSLVKNGPILSADK